MQKKKLGLKQFLIGAVIPIIFGSEDTPCVCVCVCHFGGSLQFQDLFLACDW